MRTNEHANKQEGRTDGRGRETAGLGSSLPKSNFGPFFSKAATRVRPFASYVACTVKVARVKWQDMKKNANKAHLWTRPTRRRRRRREARVPSRRRTGLVSSAAAALRRRAACLLRPTLRRTRRTAGARVSERTDAVSRFRRRFVIINAAVFLT